MIFNRIRSFISLNRCQMCLQSTTSRNDTTNKMVNVTRTHGSVPLTKVSVPPTSGQLRTLFIHSAVPMIGFGIMDQLVMISCGDLIDNTLGVRFGLATLTAAACGQVFSDVTGVCFGGVVQSIASKLGLRNPDLSHAQRNLTISRRTATAGAAIGVMCGCFTGMLVLLVLDTTAKDSKKRKHEMGVVFTSILEHSKNLIGAESCCLYKIGKNEDIVKYAEVHTDTATVDEAQSDTDTINDTNIIRDISRTGKIMQISDVKNNSNLIAVPVKSSEGAIIAVIVMKNISKEGKFFDANDEKLCNMLANHVAVIFEQMG